ncbi:flavin-containing monooxygenase [Actinoplanes sp. CA-142083]|uniref:flavin-containing monooxygenase n=1 Tax=Actinoplanes sp. CA-142083 TaxID=3239903 RepID=UPI003D8D4F7E
MTGSEEYDVVIVGAGFSGLYAIHRIRRLGLSLRCFEAGDGVGGTWYWNRYPGARVDIESMQYSYSFDEGLQQEWKWPEYFSPQADLEAYANHVADRFGLREHIEFETRVNRLRFDEAENRWHIAAENGRTATAKYIVAACGSLDATNVPAFPGLDTFRGQWFHTSKWPKDGVPFEGKRVGLIGTGSTGIQAVPVIAKTAEHLTVFQRTPAYSLPAYNRATDPEYEQAWKANYQDRRTAMFGNFAASYMENEQYRSVFDYTPEERLRILEEAWAARNGLLFMRTFSDIGTSLEANTVVAEFVRDKIRGLVKDPAVAEMLCPKTYPIGAKRICMDTGYFEAYNRDNVKLVDVRANPIAEITPTGLRTTTGEYDLDIIVFATGFDAVTGSMTRMNVTGLGGRDLRDKWTDGPTTYLGFLVAGFPNLFMIHGPGSPGVLAQMITAGEWQVDFVAGLIADMEAAGRHRIDTAPEWERRWNLEVEEAAGHTLYNKADSWYVGANIPGKPRVFMIYIGGFDRYKQRCTEQVTNGYEGFVFDAPIGASR